MKKNKTPKEDILNQEYAPDEIMETAPESVIEDTAPPQEGEFGGESEVSPPAAPKIKNPAKAKKIGLSTLEGILYALGFPIIVILALVFGVKTYQMVPYYTVWPFIGTIIVGVLAIVFLIVALCVTSKRAKRSIRSQTVVLCISAVCLTSVLGILLDVVLPDVVAKVSSSTLYAEDMVNNYDAQAKENAGLTREFVRLNILNGNYDAEYSYKNLSAKKGLNYVDEEINVAYQTYFGSDVKAYVDSLSGSRKELYDFIYNSYVLMDYNYAFKMDKLNETNDYPLRTRQSFALAVTQKVLPLYDKLCKEGFKNERLTYLFNNNYASMDQDGYVTFDDALLLYATSNRMTVPVIIRLLLDDNYTYSDGAKATIENGVIVEPDGTYFFEIYDPDAVAEYVTAGGSFNASYPGVPEAADITTGPAGKAAVNDKGWVLFENGYVRHPYKWCVLDMDGKNMDVTTLDVNGMIAGLVGSGLADTLNSVMGGVFGILHAQQTSKDMAVEELLEGLTDVIMTAANGAKLSLHLYADDNNMLAISLVPTNVEKGLLGYQNMTWLQSNNLLIAVISVMSTRNWLYVFGAVTVVLVFAAGCCRELRKKISDEEKAAKDDEPENEPTPDEAQPEAENPISEI